MIDLRNINHSKINFEWFESQKTNLATFLTLGKIAIIPSSIFIYVGIIMFFAVFMEFLIIPFTCFYLFLISLYIIYLRSSKMLLILKLKINNKIKKEQNLALLSELQQQREEIDLFFHMYPIYNGKDDIYKDVKEYFLY